MASVFRFEHQALWNMSESRSIQHFKTTLPGSVAAKYPPGNAHFKSTFPGSVDLNV